MQRIIKGFMLLAVLLAGSLAFGETYSQFPWSKNVTLWEKDKYLAVENFYAITSWSYEAYEKDKKTPGGSVYEIENKKLLNNHGNKIDYIVTFNPGKMLEDRTLLKDNLWLWDSTNALMRGSVNFQSPYQLYFDPGEEYVYHALSELDNYPINVSSNGWWEVEGATNVVVQIAEVTNAEVRVWKTLFDSDVEGKDPNFKWYDGNSSMTSEKNHIGAFNLMDGRSDAVPSHDGTYELKMIINGPANSLTKTAVLKFEDIGDNFRFKSPALAANVWLENHYPWENSIDYMVSFDKPLDLTMFDENHNVWIGLTTVDDHKDQIDPRYQIVTNALLDASQLSKIETVGGKDFYRINIDLTKYPVLDNLGVSGGVDQGDGLTVTAFVRAGAKSDTCLTTSSFRGYRDAVVLNTLSPRTVETRDTTFTRLPIYVSPTAWGLDENSASAEVEIAYVGPTKDSEKSDDECVWLPMTNITAQTVVRTYYTEPLPGFWFNEGNNVPKYKGLYRLRMTTENGVTKTTAYYFESLPEKPVEPPSPKYDPSDIDSEWLKNPENLKIVQCDYDVDDGTGKGKACWMVGYNLKLKDEFLLNTNVTMVGWVEAVKDRGILKMVSSEELSDLADGGSTLTPAGWKETDGYYDVMGVNGTNNVTGKVIYFLEKNAKPFMRIKIVPPATN